MRTGCLTGSLSLSLSLSQMVIRILVPTMGKDSVPDQSREGGPNARTSRNCSSRPIPPYTHAHSLGRSVGRRLSASVTVARNESDLSLSLSRMDGTRIRFRIGIEKGGPKACTWCSCSCRPNRPYTDSQAQGQRLGHGSWDGDPDLSIGSDTNIRVGSSQWNSAKKKKIKKN